MRIVTVEDPIDGGWVAHIIERPGMLAQGETPEDAIDHVLDVLDIIGWDRAGE